MNNRVNPIITPSEDPILKKVKKEIDEYIEENVRKIINYKKQDTDNCYPSNEELANLIPMSDILDQEHHQYVDLVMEGGGMHGIALLGYIGLLEALNIRFLNIAGTSAGAITATLLMAINEAKKDKFHDLLHILTTKSFYDFVDGKESAKHLINTGLQPHTNKLRLLWSTYKAWPDLRENLGLNPGDAFEEWIEKLLGENNQLDNFQKFLQDTQPELLTREPVNSDRVKKLNSSCRRLALITADITTGSKVELPAMTNLYLNWGDKNRTLAKFVRASMSVPYFFSPVIFDRLPKSMTIFEKWCEDTNLKLDLSAIKEAQLLVLKDQDQSYEILDDEEFKKYYINLYQTLKKYLNGKDEKSFKAVELFRLLPDLCSEIVAPRESHSPSIPELIVTRMTTKSLDRVKELLEDKSVRTLIHRLYSDEHDNASSYYNTLMEAIQKLISLNNRLNTVYVRRFNFSSHSNKYAVRASNTHQDLKISIKKSDIEKHLKTLDRELGEIIIKISQKPLDTLNQELNRIHSKLKLIIDNYNSNNDDTNLNEIEAIKKEINFYKKFCPLLDNLLNIDTQIIKNIKDDELNRQKILKDIQEDKYRSNIFKLAQKELDKIPKSVTLIDGGVISNFPISVFHSNDSATPLSPTLGVKLGLDAYHYDTQSVTQIFSAMFNSSRNTSDFEFIKQNPDYTHLLTYIEIPEDKFNWLDFNMSLRQKMELIRLGVDAAVKFILGFDWERYKAIRTSLSKVQAKSDLLAEEKAEIEKQIEEDKSDEQAKIQEDKSDEQAKIQEDKSDEQAKTIS